MTVAPALIAEESHFYGLQMLEQLRGRRQLGLGLRLLLEVVPLRSHDGQLVLTVAQPGGERLDRPIARLNRRRQPFDRCNKPLLVLVESLSFGLHAATGRMELADVRQHGVSHPGEREHLVHHGLENLGLGPLAQTVDAVPALAIRRGGAAEVAVCLPVGIHLGPTDAAHEHVGEQPAALAGGAAERMACTADRLLEDPPLVDHGIGLVPERIRHDPQVLALASLHLVGIVPDVFRLSRSQLPLRRLDAEGLRFQKRCQDSFLPSIRAASLRATEKRVLTPFSVPATT